jgi:hypothetical protein
MGAPRHELVDETDAAIELTTPARVNFNATLLELLDTYVRAVRRAREHHPFDHICNQVIVLVPQRVYDMAKAAGLLEVLKVRFPDARVEIKATGKGIRGPHPTHVIFDEAAGFER